MAESLDLDRLEELAKKAVATEGKTRYCLEMEFQDAVTPEAFLALIDRLRRAEEENVRLTELIKGSWS